MGIYDREYYRRDGPGFLGSLTSQGQVTNGLIILNVVCFIAQVAMRSADPILGVRQEPFTDALSLNVGAVLHGQVWRLLSYAFLHDPDSIWHILMNMLFLFWFGRQVEDAIGGREYLRFYLVSAVVAGVGFVFATLLGLHGNIDAATAIGASGAVTAVLVLAAFINPRQVILMFFVLPIPIWGFIVLNVAIDAFNLMGRSQGVATSAHLAGAGFSYLYYKMGWRVGNWFNWLPSWKRVPLRARPDLKLYRESEERPVAASTATTTAPRVSPSIRTADSEQIEAQVDAILEKIARVGMEGLTESERGLLLRASEIMKRRRS